MRPATAGYMAWSKTHPRARFELAGSGAPTLNATEFQRFVGEADWADAPGYGDRDCAERIGRRRGVAPESVLLMPGTSMANLVALASVTSPGDRVAIEQPCYDPLVRAAVFLELSHVSLPRQADDRYRPDLDAVERALGEGATAVVLTNLHNPSGMLCDAEDLTAVARLTADHGASLIIDEVYLDLAAINGGLTPVRGAALGDHVVTTDSLTKVYGLGPLRAGWMIAAPAVLEQARHVVDLLHVNHPVLSAKAAARALDSLDDLADRSRKVYQSCFPIFQDWVGSRCDVRMDDQHGALFAWLRLPEGVFADRLAALLADEFDTSVVPGTYFGDNRHIRIGLNVEPPVLSGGLERLGSALDRLT